jgi:hypothetical protein
MLAAVNDLQVTRSRLLLALRDADAGTLDAVEAAVEAFEDAWARLQAVYAKTRLRGAPEGTIPDAYHHLASRTLDESWLVARDEALIRRIRSWVRRGAG